MGGSDRTSRLSTALTQAGIFQELGQEGFLEAEGAEGALPLF